MTLRHLRKYARINGAAIIIVKAEMVKPSGALAVESGHFRRIDRKSPLSSARDNIIPETIILIIILLANAI